VGSQPWRQCQVMRGINRESLTRVSVFVAHNIG
jgi:hypothetical protein